MFANDSSVNNKEIDRNLAMKYKLQLTIDFGRIFSDK